MAHDPLSDVVVRQYSKWVYPEPIIDLDQWLLNNWQWFDPSHAHQIFWPDRPYPEDLDILIAGCGTNQAAIIAHTNPSARVTAIDVSQPSLDHHSFLKQKYKLDNLDLHLLPIEKVGDLGRDFDLIISTGVLHHMASAEQGMEALAQRLRPAGVAAIMLYARYGRIGVEMMQAVVRDMGWPQDEATLPLVRALLSSLPQDHPIKSYLSLAPDLQYDAGLVDTFLHGRDRSFTIEDCRTLAEGAGLVFQDLFLKSSYYPTDGLNDGLQGTLRGLPAEKLWSVMERINHRNACHFFLACRADRPAEEYRISFDPAEASAMVPAFRFRCGLSGQQIQQPNWSRLVTYDELAVVSRIDGQRSLADIVRITGVSQTFSICERLWQQDFLNILIRR